MFLFTANRTETSVSKRDVEVPSTLIKSNSAARFYNMSSSPEPRFSIAGNVKFRLYFRILSFCPSRVPSCFTIFTFITYCLFILNVCIRFFVFLIGSCSVIKKNYRVN